MAALDKAFTATLQESPAKRGSTYVVMPACGVLQGAKGRVTVTGMVDGTPFITSFTAGGNRIKKLPLNASVRSAISKRAGDTVTVFLEDWLDQ